MALLPASSLARNPGGGYREKTTSAVGWVGTINQLRWWDCVKRWRVIGSQHPASDVLDCTLLFFRLLLSVRRLDMKRTATTALVVIVALLVTVSRPADKTASRGARRRPAGRCEKRHVGSVQASVARQTSRSRWARHRLSARRSSVRSRVEAVRALGVDSGSNR